MSVRSSARELVVIAVLAALAAACRKPPEADPKRVTALAARISANAPVPGAVRDCTPKDLSGGITMTERTAWILGGTKIHPGDVAHAAWINPAELDSPAALTLLDEGASVTDRRRAAAEWLAAPFYLVYRIDHVGAPFAQELLEYKRGGAGARALRYNKRGELVCLVVFNWLNDDVKMRQAFDTVRKKGLTKEVVRDMRGDLKDQMLKKVESLLIPKPK